MKTGNMIPHINTYLNTARMLLKRGAVEEGRQYLLAMLEMRCREYNSAINYIDQAVLGSEIREWFDICVELREKGLTERIRAKLRLFDEQTGQNNYSGDKSGLGRKHESPIENLLKSNDDQGWCARIFEEYKQAVGALSCSSRGVTGKSGTGFVISDKGYVLTNDHVVFCEAKGEYFDTVKIKLGDSNEAYILNIIQSSKKHDVAVCRFESEQSPCDKVIRLLQDYTLLKPGAEIVVIGNGLNMGLAPLPGGIKYVRNSEGMLVYTAPSNHGDSGGPVLNRSGLCIGINSSVIVGAVGHTNAVPSDTVLELLDKWKIEI